MKYFDFLDKIIESGIDAARRDYHEGSKLEGAIAGFEECRGKSPEIIRDLLSSATKKVNSLFCSEADVDEYWRAVCFMSEVQWTLNCICAAFGEPVTANTAVHANRILNEGT